jgi:hypothetical protein
MVLGQVKCTHCKGSFPLDGESGWTERVCHWCNRELYVHAFPSLTKPRRAEAAGNAAPAEGQAACYFHARKSAAVPCDACGRFLCDLCDLGFRGRHYCATCLDAAQKGKSEHAKEAADLLKERAFLPQNVAILLSFYSPLTLFGLYLLPLTAPAALWFTFRYWNRNEGFQVRGRWRSWLAIILAISQILFVAATTAFLVYALYKTAKDG